MFAAGTRGRACSRSSALIASEALPVIVARGGAVGGRQPGDAGRDRRRTSPSTASRSHRNELFAIQFAIQNVTNIIAAILGGVVAGADRRRLGLDPAGPGHLPDHPRADGAAAWRLAWSSSRGCPTTGRTTAGAHRLRRLGEPAAFPADPRRSADVARASGSATGRCSRSWCIPGLLISIGAGQVIPFLNLYVQQQVRARPDVAQRGVRRSPRWARSPRSCSSRGSPGGSGRSPRSCSSRARASRSSSCSGFSPVLWTVILAMAVRNSLMNAGNPIFNAFAMERVSPAGAGDPVRRR